MQRHVNDHELLLALDGELSPRRLSAIARHAETCTVCRERTDRIRTTIAGVDAFYRTEFAVSPGSPDYGRVRLASALRVAAASEPTWFQRLFQGHAGLSLSHGSKVGIAMIAVCAAALISTRSISQPTVGGLPPGALPEPSLTPGAVAGLTTAELCNGVRPSRVVTEAVRQQVLRAYGMEAVPAASYELDALVTPELGGSTNQANLWPQRYHSPVWNARVKDELERLLPEMVCDKQIPLAQAQREIASDWIAAYKRYFKTETPLRAHLGPLENEDPELLFVAAEPTMTRVATVRLVSR